MVSTARLLRAHLAHGSALLLLDGMDEVPVSTTTSARQVASASAAAVRAGRRVPDVERGRQPAAADEPSLRPLRGAGRAHDARARRRCSRCRASCSRCWRIAGSPCCRASREAGAETAADLFANIDSQPWLVELAANPLLLTAMCIVFDEGKRLPQDKHELYERVVATVLYSRYQDPADIDKVKRELGVIAYGMHTGAGLGDGRATPKAEATFHEVERWLQDYQERKDYTERAEAGAFEAREALLSQSGLFLSTGDDRAGFAHLSFQEFFAAQRTLHGGRGAARRRVPRVARPTPEWRNTLSFLFGRLVGTFPEPKKAIDLLEARLERASASDTGLLLVLADAAQVLTGKGITLRAESLQRLQRLLLEAMTGSAPVAIRADVGFGPRPAWRSALSSGSMVAAGRGPARVHQGRGGSLHDGERSEEGSSTPETTNSRNTSSSCRTTTSRAIRSRSRSFARSSRTRSFRSANPDCLRGVPNHPVSSGVVSRGAGLLSTG